MTKTPYFDDGDVLVVVSGNRRYRLHERILSPACGLFRELLADYGPSSPLTGSGGRPCFYLWLVQEEDLTWSFRRDGVDVNRYPHNDYWPEDAESKTTPPVFTYLDYVFKILYHRVVPSPLDTLFHHAPGLLAFARYLQATDVTLSRIEQALFGENQILLRKIANDPIHWLHWGFDIRARLITEEALAHIVGRYNEMSIMRGSQRLSAINPSYKSLVNSVRNAFKDQCMILELQVVRSIPHSVARLHDGPVKSFLDHQKDILHPMATALFRQWWCARLANGDGHNGLDSGFRLYKELEAGLHTFIDSRTVYDFRQTFPMSEQNQIALDSVLNNIVKEVQHGVRFLLYGILRNGCQLNTEISSVYWLTSGGRLHDEQWRTSRPVDYVGLAHECPGYD